MNRRGFLKFLPAVAILPPVLANLLPKSTSQIKSWKPLEYSSVPPTVSFKAVGPLRSVTTNGFPRAVEILPGNYKPEAELTFSYKEDGYARWVCLGGGGGGGSSL